MNIFAVDKNPTVSGKMLCDKHISKMSLESAQMLSTVCRKIYGVEGDVKSVDKNGKGSIKKRRILINLGEYNGMPQSERSIIYWGCHHKHPCTLWVGKSFYNWEWLCLHAISLCEEFFRRYKHEHKSLAVIKYIHENGFGPKNKDEYSKEQKHTPFAMAMPEQYKSTDPVESYRTYYLNDKKRFARWKHNNPPDWWKGKHNG